MEVGPAQESDPQWNCPCGPKRSDESNPNEGAFALPCENLPYKQNNEMELAFTQKIVIQE